MPWAIQRKADSSIRPHLNVWHTAANRVLRSPGQRATTKAPRSSSQRDSNTPLSPRTEETYVHWIKRFIFFHNKRHPVEMGEKEIAQFLSGLASDSHVGASTQNQALNAILFLYREVLRKEIGYVNGVVGAKKPRRLPVVLTKEEVKRVLGQLSGSPWLMSMLLYGVGLRVMECCRLRVKDIEFSQNEITCSSG
jgi:integrase